jgi:S-adenosylmethionine:tRNA ribosyltransferase-isomerase
VTEASLLDQVDFELPPERVAQTPAAQREAARLLVLNRRDPARASSHCHVRDLGDWLRAGDLLVVNTTRVLSARLRGHKRSGGKAEALVLAAVDPDSATPEGVARDGRYRALVKTRGKLRPGLHFDFRAADSDEGLGAELESIDEDGCAILAFPPGSSPFAIGEPPLPPYIRRSPKSDERVRRLDRARYQTVFARHPGAVAAPTAGLHLSESLLSQLECAGIERAELVLHVGIGTFRPPSEAELCAGQLHAERYRLPEATQDAIAATRERGGRVVAVGTTSARVLETCAAEDGRVKAGEGCTRLFMRPGSRFRVVDGLLTNFHLPRSSLLLLVAAFAGRERALAAYAEAVRLEYRFYSYGDAMLIL